MANPGKDFEKDFLTSTEKYGNISIDRFHDGVGGYAVKNICDFVVYNHPNQFYFELKSYKGDKIYFDCLSDKQFEGLISKSKINGVVAGVLFNFREYEKSYFVPITIIDKMKSKEQKGITLIQAALHGIEMEIIKKRRVTYDYNVEKLLIDIQNMEVEE